jgi:hypothetical protein
MAAVKQPAEHPAEKSCSKPFYSLISYQFANHLSPEPFISGVSG